MVAMTSESHYKPQRGDIMVEMIKRYHIVILAVFLWCSKQK